VKHELVDLDQLWAEIEAAAPLESSDDLPAPPIGVDEDGWRERESQQYDRRRSFFALYSWAVPTRKAIESIGTFVGERKLLEVCAGQGLWARLLSAAGVDMLATDGSGDIRFQHFPVAVEEAEAAVRAHPDRAALMLCWPPYKDDCAHRALRVFRGDSLIYVGDVRFTADEQLHRLIESGWDLRQRIVIPAWPGLDDYVYLYRRRG
jgi:hypothetical protein